MWPGEDSEGLGAQPTWVPGLSPPIIRLSKSIASLCFSFSIWNVGMVVLAWKGCLKDFYHVWEVSGVQYVFKQNNSPSLLL